MKYYVLAYTLMMCILLYTADIPTHCYQSHVEGEWIFEATTPRSLDKKELYEHTCGHKNPSHENSSHLATIKKELLTQNFKITFNKDNTVQLNYGGKERKGTWTMIYNEGFDVRIKEENISFFAFLKYAPFNNKAGWQSFCYQILPGWFHIGGEWGCFTGNKNVDKWNAATNNGIEDAVKIVFPIKERFLEKLHEIQESAQEMRFSESQTAVTFTLDTTFSEMVEKLNSMNLSWKACNYPQFDGMTLRDLNKFVGRKKKMNQRHTERDIFATQTNLFKSSSYEKKSTDTTIIKHATISAKERATGSIPASFSWRNHPVWKNKILPKPRQQGGCGSCFAASTLSMLEARFKYQLLERKEIDADQAFSLSLQHVLDCSYYNQGCDGGYSYLVSKFYNEFDLRSEESYRNNQQCYPSDSINDKNFKRFSVSDYYYVGGAYGRTNEQNMIEELYRRGPFVVSLEPGTIFASVCSGEIYDGPNKVIRIENWERVDHSVLLVGYGVDEKSGKKYWEILNSWGESWCDGGFTRVLRGKNMMSIESIGEAAIPEIN